MSEWKGFDQRKVCPQCGDYQTRLNTYERRTDSRGSRSLWIFLTVLLIVTLLLIILTVVIVVTRKVPLKPYQFVGLFLTVRLGISQLLNLSLKSRKQKRETRFDPISQGSRSTMFHLTCWSCGYEWEMTIDEWEQMGQAES